MKLANELEWRGLISKLLQSYGTDVRKWGARIVAGYATAAVLLVGGILALFAAIAVGFAALFRWIERYYGSDIAFGTIGFGLLVLAIVLILWGLATLKRRAPPVPRPHRQVQAAKQMVAPLALNALAPLAPRGAVRAKDSTTQLYVGVAGAMLAYWLVASRVEAFASRHRARK